MSYVNYYEKSGMFHGSLPNIMGTRLDALLFGADRSFLDNAWDQVVAELERLQSMLNIFDPASELSLLNKKAIAAPVVVSDELWNILQDAKKYHELTSGFFDITLSGFQGIEWNPDQQTVFCGSESLSFDLGGYAKGYAMQKTRNLLLRLGLNQAFINFGDSSVMALGIHPSGKSWLVGIDNPYSPGQILGTVELCDSSLSTSGNMPRHDRHIVNPHTGETFTGRRVVSVVAASDLVAEILSTALLLADEITGERIQKNFKNINVYNFRIP